MRKTWRVWKGVGEIPCPICETRCAAQDLVEHLWSHKLVETQKWYWTKRIRRFMTGPLPEFPIPRAVKRSGLAPCCGENFRTSIEAARHIRELYDADKLDVHVVETATAKVFAPKASAFSERAEDRSGVVRAETDFDPATNAVTIKNSCG